MYCRANFAELNDTERARLARAFNDVEARDLIASFAEEHDVGFENGIHRGPAFLPWHRHFLLRMEAEMRKTEPLVTIPYWDWTRADSRDLDDGGIWESFFGGRSNTGGQFDDWDYTRRSTPRGGLPTMDTVLDEIGAPNYTAFRAMEFGTHVPGHVWTGGTMVTGASPGDPLFYLHHANVDRLWAIWQLNHENEAQYSLDDCDGCLRWEPAFVPLHSPMVGVAATPASMLELHALGYYYSPDRRLERRAEELGNPGLSTSFEDLLSSALIGVFDNLLS